MKRNTKALVVGLMVFVSLIVTGCFPLIAPAHLERSSQLPDGRLEKVYTREKSTVGLLPGTGHILFFGVDPATSQPQSRWLTPVVGLGTLLGNSFLFLPTLYYVFAGGQCDSYAGLTLIGRCKSTSSTAIVE
jgi:hypothetical protein